MACEAAWSLGLSGWLRWRHVPPPPRSRLVLLYPLKKLEKDRNHCKKKHILKMLCNLL